MLKKLWKSEKGFTLMELIIVIVILGILALLAVPRLIGFTETAAISADEEYAAVLGRAGELYFAANKGDIAFANGDYFDDLTSGDNALAPVDKRQSEEYSAGDVEVLIASDGQVTVEFNNTQVYQTE